jgi:hypothetical protein
MKKLIYLGSFSIRNLIQTEDYNFLLIPDKKNLKIVLNDIINKVSIQKLSLYKGVQYENY